MYIFTQLNLTGMMQHKVIFFSWVKLVWIEFTFSLTGWVSKPILFPLLQGVSTEMQPIIMIMIYYWDEHNRDHLNHVR